MMAPCTSGHMCRVIAVTALLAGSLGAQASVRAAVSPTDRAITSRRATRIADSLLALMTLEEKLGQLTQAPTGDPIDSATERQIRAGQLGSVLGLWGADATHKAQRAAIEQSRLHIPLLFGFDVIHGMRTIYPVPL